MAIIRVLQDWGTFSGTAGFTQAERDYVDVTDLQDIVIYPQFSSITGTPTVTFESAPLKEEALFLAISAAITPSTTLAAIVVRYASGTPTNPPLAKYLRWRVAASGTWSLTMRLLVAGNPNLLPSR